MSRARELAKEYGLVAVEDPVGKRWVFIKTYEGLPVLIATINNREIELSPDSILKDRIVKGLIEKTWGDADE